MRILGIDPGSAATGYGVVERRAGQVVHVAHGTLRPQAAACLAARLEYLHRAIGEVIVQHAPDCAAIEEVFVAANPRSALVLGQARGAILAALGAAGLPVSEYTPARIKRSVTGNGRATKQQVKLMVKRSLCLPRPPAADAADALAAAIAHARAGRLEALGARGSAARPRPRRERRVFGARRPL